MTMNEIKINAAVQALLANGMNQSRAAKELGISRGGLRLLLSLYVGKQAEEHLNTAVLVKYRGQ